MTKDRFTVLDGWRGVSILAVLAAHLLPLGPKSWQLNATAGPFGMAIFFTLSGFLITFSLNKNPSLTSFVIRRVMRILPLAWLYLALTFVLFPTSIENMKALLFFYANWPPMNFTSSTTHIWSLCVEMQFYFCMATIFLVAGQRSLWIIPFLCLLVALNKISNDVVIAINTYYRIDEILAGGILAIFYNSPKEKVVCVLKRIDPIYFLVLLVISCHPASGIVGYFRPYFSGLLVAVTLYNSNSLINRLLSIELLAYVAVISYALYIIHPILKYTWLGDGETVEKYLKRPLLFLVLFFLAHLSTFYYEKHWIAWAKRITNNKI